MNPSPDQFMLFDSHLHLQDERIVGDLAPILLRAQSQGVTGCCCCGSAEDDWEDVAQIAREHTWVVPAFGLHPWYIDRRTSGWQGRLQQMLLEHPRAGVGEIGLDRGIEVDFLQQQDVFAQCLAIAAQRGRPVSIHCRRAWEPLLSILRQHAQMNGPIKGLIHSYSGSAQLVPELQKLGLMVSFSGSITHDRNRRAREAAAAVRDDRILIETDSPDILPAGTEGPHNEPANLPLVAGALAQIRISSLHEIGHLTMENARRLLIDS